MPRGDVQEERVEGGTVTQSTGGGSEAFRPGEVPDSTRAVEGGSVVEPADPAPAPSSPPTNPDAGGRSGRARSAPAEGRIGSRDGLIAVTVGIVSVSTLAVVTLVLLRNGNDAASTVSVATSAFGVISALVGAYLGIKIGTEQTQGIAQGAQRDAQAASARAGAMQTYVLPS